MNSITQLFNDLCESHMVGFPWTTGIGTRKRNKNRTKQSLKRLAYDTLFVHLFQEEVRRLQPNTTKLPVKNKMLMLSFNLRMGGMDLEAERLEELVEHVEKTSDTQVGDVYAVLELLIDLAGTGPPQVLPPKRDLFQNNKYVGRKPRYHGYDYYDVSIFEADLGTFLAHQECEISNTVHRTLQIMEGEPGTGLPAIGLFSQNFTTIDKFERETRVSLFGALVHSRTNDMDIKLDLPPVPDSADLSGLAIKVPQSIDQSEDEGFQSASNMTPDSQSEPSVTPDIDLWEAVLTYGPSKRRCWERIGCPPGKREDPYLTEAGREAFDRLYKIYEGTLQILNNTVPQPSQNVMVTEPELVKDALNALLGVVSSTFSFNQSTQAFIVKQGVYISGTTPENISNLLTQVGEYGTYYTRLSCFSLQTVLDSSHSKGLVFQAFTSGLRKYLQYYRACVLSTPGTLTLLTISFLFRKLGRQLRYLAELCCIGTLGSGVCRGNSALFPTGVKLLSYLYKEALENGSNENYPVLLSLLKTCCEPYTRFVYDWVYSGVFRDVCGEFMIQVNQDFLGFRDRRYWTHGYTFISKEVEDCVPVFLKHLANEIYICGKTINLLKLCCPKHYICWSDIPVPRISVTFSLEELKEMEKDCAVYVAQMERIARYSSISREEKILQTEIAKHELIIQAHETAEKVMETFKDQRLAEKKLLNTKKRELFIKLKEQYEKDQERKLAAKQEEADDDFSYAREMRDREKRLKALEEELESKAKQELIEHYSRLSEEATRKEQKALWKLQRHKLETARLSFFMEEERRLQDLIAHIPVNASRETLDILPHVKTVRIEEHTLDPILGDDAHKDVNDGKSKEDFASSNETPTPPISQSDSVTVAETVAASSNPASLLLSPSLEPSCCTPDVDIADFIPASPCGELQVELNVELSLVDDALKDIGSDITKDTEITETIPAVEEEGSFPNDYDFSTVLKPVAFTHVSQGHIMIGENMPDAQSTRPHWNIHGHASDASIKIGSYIPDGKILHPQASQYGHSSDSHIDIGAYVSNIEPGLPQSNIHGHVSSGHIMVGQYASDVEVPQPRQNIHGHASQANIKVGENVSDVQQSRPRWNIHGHASDAHIKIGEHMTEVVSSRPRWNIHGHASQSHIQIGENVSNVEPSKPRCSSFGHVSHSSIEIGEQVRNGDSTAKPSQKSEYGHSSDSTIQGLLYGEQSNLSKKTNKECDEVKAQSSEHSIPSDAETVLSPSAIGGDEKESKPTPESLEKESRHISSVSIQDDQSSATACKDETQTEINTAPPCDDLHPALEGEEVTAPDETWEKEQRYLQALANKYCLEKYQDSYGLMSAPPVLQSLNKGILRQFEFPVDPGVHSATDETAVQLIELLSLPVLMKYSITAPMVSHVSLVNKAIVDFYFVELNMEKHFEAIRHFLLMEDGEFAQSLSDLLFEKLGSGQTPREMLTPLVLNSILNKALQYSLHGDSHLAFNLSFALKFLPEMFTPTAPDTLSCLELKYKIDWPLSIVVTESCMNKYNKIFSFLLQLKHMVWTLRDVWFHLKRTALVNQASSSIQHRQLQLYRHEMQHFVKVIQGYIANQILHVTWSEFRNKLRTVSNLEEIYRTHAEYLNKALFRGLLTEKAAPLMNIIHSIFSLILKFRIQLISQPWTCDKGKQMATHPNFGLMQQSYNTFKYYSDFLFVVVTKLVNRGYQPHLEDFLLRINFNNYYKES
ncbi:gamma-tubulin complex component 6 [Pelobates cultripes]|uniref:Gamma-tubulin complex component 6 n=1 Tax=Pelobates cultripes TaxID=61616 RepID=A0AAD1W272_PELCU|nr:gamma-tubulin complex component 6 [Pelobates cultripes]